jgi:hypothetical protein
MIVTPKCTIKTLELTWLFSTLHVLSPQFSFQTLSLYFLFDVSYNSSHLRTSSVITLSISEDQNRQHSLQANTPKCSGGDVRLFTLSESSRYRPVRTHSVTSNILAQQRRRNGTETWRRRYCQCEHLRLITHEKILLNGDVPGRNGNVTYSVNQPLLELKYTGLIAVVFAVCESLLLLCVVRAVHKLDFRQSVASPRNGNWNSSPVQPVAR